MSRFLSGGRVSRRRRPFHAESLESRHLLAANPVISEFVASNDQSLRDGNDIASDWIELYNAGDTDVDLGGWYLTDNLSNLTKWQFPSVELEAGRFLVIFASGYIAGNYVDPAGNLHTNFSLDADGEYLALVRPDLTVASAYSPEFPDQKSDVSFGTEMSTESTSLLGPGAPAKVLIPTSDIGSSWTGSSSSFDDSQWNAGAGSTTGVGYSIADEGVPGLVAEWTFETREGSSVTDGQLALGTIDETAGDLNGPYLGTASGNPSGQGGGGLVYSSDTPGGIGSQYALSFPSPENAENHALIPISPGSDFAEITMGDFRVEAWFKTTDVGRGVLTGSYVGGPTALNLELHTSNRGRLYVQGPTAITDLTVTLPTNSRDGNWHQLVGLRRGSMVELYYDGALVGSLADTAGDFVINKTAQYLGRDSRTTNVIFNGSLDNVRFYNSADTSALLAAYDFETSGGTIVSNNRSAAGPIDDSAGHASGPFHATGASAGGGGDTTLDGINYSANVPAVLTDSNYSLTFEEDNTNVESVTIGMPPAIANLTLGDFTLQAWFRTNDIGRSIMTGAFTGPDSALNFELHTDNRLRVWIQNAGGGTTDLNVSVGAVGNSRDNQWHMASAVRRGDQVELYFDGVLVGNTSDVAGSFVQSAASYYFGRDSRTDATRFDGQLDNIRFWNVALTADQIAAMALGATPAEVTGGEFDDLIGTNVQAEMAGNSSSAYIRVPFDVQDPDQFSLLKLAMQYDDGYVAYINGREVARRNAPAQLSFNSAATINRPSADAREFEIVEIGAPSSLLRSGVNILAIHGLNADPQDDNFLIVPELTGITTTINPEAQRYFPSPTPGQPNSAGFLGFVDDTSFSVDRGFYEALDLEPQGILAGGIELTTGTPNATIRYTIDGSWPTATHGTVYSQPILINTTTTLRAAAFLDGFVPSNVDTHTYLFLDDVIRQPRNPGQNQLGDPTYPLPFPLTHQPGVAADYEMDPEVVNNPLYAGTIKDDLKSIPTLSLVMDMDDIFNQPNGIWANSQSSGIQWERLTSAEFFDPQDPDREFQVNAAIRMQGRASRVPSSSIKHSFRLIFKDTYGPEGAEQPTGGPTKLNFPWFASSDVDEFDTVILRGGYNYSYAHAANDQNIRAQYVRERFMRESQIAMGQLGSSGSYVHLYVNGLYFGLYAPQERPDASFMSQHLGGDKEDYDVISAGEVRDGSADAWNELLTRSAADLSIPANYDAVVEMLDVDSLIDYMILHIWGGTTDWPAPGGQLRNWVVGRERTEGAGFKFFVWDAEYSIQGTNDNVVSVNDANTPAFIYSQLRANPEFRLAFADRVQQHFFNDGALTPEANIDRYAALAAEIERAIVGESARWGDVRGDACNPCLRDPLWYDERDWILDTYMPGRTATVLNQFAAANLYPQTAAPEFNQHGGNVDTGFQLELSAPASELFIDTPLLASPTATLVYVPTDNLLGTTWTETNFVPDEAWFDGQTGVGYERGTGYEPYINTDVDSQMFNQGTSVYLRIPFEYNAAASFDRLQLQMRYDDGFVAYINGIEVARSNNLPAGTPDIATIPGSHEGDLLEFFDIDLDELPPDLLQSGANVLAIHGMNRTNTSTDLLIWPSLIGRVRDTSTTARPIWYTTDGSDPRLPGGAINPSAIQYTGAFALTENAQIKTRVFHQDEWSALTEATFVIEAPPIAITEINYHPYAPTADEQLAMAGVVADDFEFIELHNTDANSTLSLDGFAFSNGISFTFAGQTLAPGEYAVLVEDTAAFQLRYGTETRILGEWNGALSNNGERVELLDSIGNVVLDFQYDTSAAWPQSADGVGATLELVSSTTSPDRVGKPYAWRGSTEFGGSPGREGSAPVGLVINEIRSRSSSTRPELDAIELYNPTDALIDASGWYLSDSATELLKFRIPDGTILAPHSYRVFDENDFNPTPATPLPTHFALNGDSGDSVWLVTADGMGAVATFVDDVHFGAVSPGTTLGRFQNGSGPLVPMARNTLGCANTYPQFPDVMISEVQYHPAAPSSEALAIDPELEEDDLEFIELTNLTGQLISLANWTLRGGIDYNFADTTALGPLASLVVVSFNPNAPANSARLAALRHTYGIGNEAVIIGGWDGQLSNSSEEVRLSRPDVPNPDSPTLIPRVVEDVLWYDDLAPWPAGADGTGSSLTRVTPTSFAPQPTSWSAAVPTPGSAALAGGVTGDFSGDTELTSIDIDMLFDAVRRNSHRRDFDLDENSVVDVSDVTYLLQSLLGTRVGDANLDGSVDAADFNVWNAHRFQSCTGWDAGDFNGDGATDVSDLNLWNANKFSAPVAAQAVAATRAPREPLATITHLQPLSAPALDAAYAQIQRSDAANSTCHLSESTPILHEQRFDAALVRMSARIRRTMPGTLQGLRFPHPTPSSNSPSDRMIDDLFASNLLDSPLDK